MKISTEIWNFLKSRGGERERLSGKNAINLHVCQTKDITGFPRNRGADDLNITSSRADFDFEIFSVNKLMKIVKN